MSKSTELAELVAVLATEPVDHGQGVAGLIRDAQEILRIGRGVARRALDECNGDGRPGDDARDVRALDRASVTAQVYGASVFATGDPRGYTFRLRLKSGRYNTLGGPEGGWGVC